ncbi:bifunctional diaminohydroxyphosphoribosylaminopyrimidine deaminase/5-amino-6-(5-phosphoribosylamino)uracil reductase RibD [Acetobacter musti]|uniref:Riboflavin biosynthesis protein RibD n=1 Tax=Acetobacter musti TaxID=864732 RepID=A0ABX0JL49_9PROT|nr:bifunctional diaminohydroxyphosphoribosylaminopyrimidine deaminase/5-amino-6-(5-phosphoribosylamino)uracil reductase RibD [Acetobacter musti]NHN83211.1 bifunctional diaminohydroxyphosphoribosylaminopyrimidine deaminase/5-amino-6-(5-phosphoribosylamino)uracil reductase RibD [Acetobacter musti]
MVESPYYNFIVEAFRAALAEACRFVGATAPNPPVGCALLDNRGNVLSVGAHQRAGKLHAEALALKQCAALGLTHLIDTAVVTLEPCNHTGRTPPCSEALLATPVKTVWIGCSDPNPDVAGGGAARLRSAGREVRWISEISGIRPEAMLIAEECCGLIAPFQKRSVLGEAWLTIKQAVDANGSMIPPPGQKTFTSSGALELAHQLRRSADAIVTAPGTILADLPRLDVRHIEDHAERRRLLLICSRSRNVPKDWLDGAHKRFDVLWCSKVEDAPRLLAENGAMWALVEAGPSLLSAIAERKLWDDWLRIEVNPDGSECVSVERRHKVTPMWLLPGLMTSAPSKAYVSNCVVGQV